MSSAVKKVICARIIVREISTSSLFFIFSIPLEKPIQKSVQRSIPPTIIDANVKKPVIYMSADISPVSITHRIMRNNATAVPSLKRLSHSNMIDKRRGAPTDLKVASTAIGSVAEMRLPKSKHTKNGIWKPTTGSKTYSHAPIKTVEINTQIILSIEMETIFFKRSL